VLDLRDSAGVLSAYFNDAGPRSSRPRDRNGPLSQLVAASRADRNADVVALEGRLAALDRPRLSRSGAPGVAVFVGVGSGRTIEVPCPSP
jgi:hypothetical protein